jgi:hypothetical protein
MIPILQIFSTRAYIPEILYSVLLQHATITKKIIEQRPQAGEMAREMLV